MTAQLTGLADELIGDLGLTSDHLRDGVTNQIRFIPNTAAAIKRKAAERLDGDGLREAAESLGSDDRFKVTPETMMVLGSLSPVHSDAALALALAVAERLEAGA